MTESQNQRIDALQRRMLRKYVLDIKYPKIMKNSEVYKRTNTTLWSTVIAHRRIRWFGHEVRLDERTPAKQALNYVLQNYRRKRGRPKTTWLKIIESQLKNFGSLEELLLLAKDKNQWRKLVNTWLQDVAPATNTVS